MITFRFSSKKFKKPKQPSRAPKVEDVVLSHENKELSFKKKKWRIEVDGRDVKQFFSNYRQSLVLLGLIVLIGGALGYFLISRADTADFYPASCLGGWQNPQNAEGKPDLSPNADPSQFNDSNSAVLRNMISQMICGHFQGKIPQDAQAKKAIVKFSLAIKPRSDVLIINLLGGTTTLSTGTTTGTGLSSTTSLSAATSTPSTTPQIKLDSNSAASSTPASTSTNIIVPTSSLPIITPTSTINHATTTPPKTSFLQNILSYVFSHLVPQTAEATSTEAAVTSTPSSPAANTAITSTTITNTANTSAAATSTPIIIQPSTTTPITNSAPTSSNSASSSPLSMPLNPSSTPLISTSSLIISPSSTPFSSATSTASTQPHNASSTITASSSILTGSTTLTSTTTPTTPSTTPKEGPAPFLEILYSYNGVSWQSLGKVTSDNWSKLEFEIPDFNWDKLPQLQIGIQSLSPIDSLPTIYLDSVWLEVQYDKIQNPAPNPQPQTESENQIVFDPQAQHSCAIDPFVIELKPNTTSAITINLHKFHLEKKEVVLLGSLPFGVEASFISNNGARLEVPINENQEIIQLREVDSIGSSAQKGSFNIPVIFSEEDNQSKSMTACQFNLIVK